MELTRVCGNTWVAYGSTALLPIYKLNDTDIVLMDTGYARLDRSGLMHLLDDNGFRVRGILCSHAHFDHTGNVRYLQQQFGCPVACHLIEAGIAVNPDSYRSNYVALTYRNVRSIFLEECFTADIIIMPGQDHIDFCGTRFPILPLPGHTIGHIGFITPDNVAYLGDSLLDESLIATAKLPTSMLIAQDLQVKESLRQLRCDACILAHKAVVTDLHPLIDANIQFYFRKRQELLDCLTDGMTHSQWIYAFCRQENIQPRNEMRFSITARNFDNFVSWMTDTGYLRVEQEFCQKAYYHNPNT